MDEQVSILENAVASGPDGIVIASISSDSTVPAVEEAVGKGIPVVTVQTDCSGSLRQCFVGTNNYNLGQDYGKQISEILQEKEVSEEDTIHVLVLMDEDRVDTSQNLILLGLRDMQTWVFWPVSADSSAWHVSVL